MPALERIVSRRTRIRSASAACQASTAQDPWLRARTSNVGLVLWPYEPRSKADEEIKEQAERDHRADLDEVEGGGTHAPRCGLGIGIGLEAPPLDPELRVGFGALALKLPAPVAAFGAFAGDRPVEAGDLRPQVPRAGVSRSAQASIPELMFVTAKPPR